MKPLDMITLLLIIIGGINWGLIGIFGFDLVSTIFAFAPIIARIIFILVGLAAVYQLIPFARMMGGGTEGRM
ncbi:MAG TPA: DUF378 domain-containing protein [Bauldia sp.]|nr:DUF378 domain-containing protein [Bauldia sp.]